MLIYLIIGAILSKFAEKTLDKKNSELHNSIITSLRESDKWRDSYYNEKIEEVRKGRQKIEEDIERRKLEWEKKNKKK